MTTESQGAPLSGWSGAHGILLEEPQKDYRQAASMLQFQTNRVFLLQGQSWVPSHIFTFTQLTVHAAPVSKERCPIVFQYLCSALYGGRWHVTGTILWLDGCPGVYITAAIKKKKSYQIHVHSPANTKQFFFCRVFESESVSRSVVSNSVATPQTVACQGPLSMGFSRQECWTEQPFPLLGDLPNPGIEPRYPALLPWWLRQ